MCLEIKKNINSKSIPIGQNSTSKSIIQYKSKKKKKTFIYLKCIGKI